MPGPQCPVCGAYGGGGHGGFCPNAALQPAGWLRRDHIAVRMPEVRVPDCPHCHALVDTHVRGLIPVAAISPPPRQAEPYQLTVRWQCLAHERHHGEWTEPSDG